MTERLERFRENIESEHENYDRDAFILDCDLRDYIAKLLDPTIKFYEVDAIYYDFSVLPENIKLDVMIRDAYLLIGIKEDTAEIVTKWIDRWEFSNPFFKHTLNHIKETKEKKLENKCDRCGNGGAHYIFEADADLCDNWNSENQGCYQKFVRFISSYADDFVNKH